MAWIPGSETHSLCSRGKEWCCTHTLGGWCSATPGSKLCPILESICQQALCLRGHAPHLFITPRADAHPETGSCLILSHSSICTSAPCFRKILKRMLTLLFCSQYLYSSLTGTLILRVHELKLSLNSSRSILIFFDHVLSEFLPHLAFDRWSWSTTCHNIYGPQFHEYGLRFLPWRWINVSSIYPSIVYH